jgi:hypothetical protein
MRVISLLQPWASLSVQGHKGIETRSWATKYRGPLLIHASANKKSVGKQLAASQPFLKYMPHIPDKQWKDRFGQHNPVLDWDALPFGAIIGMVNLDHIVSFDDLTNNSLVRLPDQIGFNTPNSVKWWQLSYEEKEFGDYNPGRYGWLMSSPKVFPKPIPAKGKLLLWNYDFDGKDDSFILQCGDCGYAACRDQFRLDKNGIDTEQEEWTTTCLKCESENVSCIIDNVINSLP